MIYQLDKKQTDFIRLLLMENFSPSFGGMLKRVLRIGKYNETERTRIKEIRLSYIKKTIVPRDKWAIRFVSDVDEVSLMNKKLQYTATLFKSYKLSKRTKQAVLSDFESITTDEKLIETYDYYNQLFQL